MKTEALSMATIHPDTLADDRLYLRTSGGFKIWCPRNKTRAAVTGAYMNAETQHPVGLMEFIDRDGRGHGITNMDTTGIYLAAKSVTAAMRGDQDEAERLGAMYEKLMTAKQAAGEVIAESGIEQAMREHEQEIPF